MIVRATDAAVVNFIANQPGVYGFIAPNPYSGEPIDLTECAERPDHYVLLHNESCDGAMVFEWSGPGIWEMHTMFLPSCRGKKALEAGREMLAYMFDELEAFCIWGQTPRDLKAARLFNNHLGGRIVGEGEHYRFGACIHYRLTRDEWEERFR